MARASVGYEMCWVALAEHSECFFEAGLFDKAMTGEVAACRAPGDEVLFGEERVGAGVIARSKMDLGEPESIVVVIFGKNSLMSVLRQLERQGAGKVAYSSGLGACRR